MENNDTDVAIVGMSVFCPGADNIDEFWRNLVNGVDSIIDVPEDRIDHSYFDGYKAEPKAIDRFYCRRGGFANPVRIDPLRYGILPVVMEGMDPEHLSVLSGVEQALHDAGVFEKNISLKKGAVIIGKGNFAGLIALRATEIIHTAAQIEHIVRETLPEIPEEVVQKIKKNFQSLQGRYQSDTAVGTMPNLVASFVANKFDMQGPAYTVDAACASGVLAVDHAIGLLNSGQCDIVVAAGIHGGQSPIFWSAFNMMGAMSHKGKIAPFSEDADGLLVGQGGGLMVLKKLDKAIADKDRIYAVIKGTGVCSDGGGSHVMVTNVSGQKRALELAWGKTGLDPKKVGYVEAHGTATMGDKTELTTLKEFFGDDSHPRAYVGSVKSNIGHTMPAAGMIGLIKTALSLYYKKIPPTLHCERPIKQMFETRFRPPQTAIDWDEEKYPLIAGVNAFGFGGINSHAVLTAYEGNANHKPKEKHFDEVLVLSAASKEALIDKLQSEDFTLSPGRCRIVVFNPSQERLYIAKSIIEEDEPVKNGHLDIWYNNEPLLADGGKLAFVFSGFDFGGRTEHYSISDYLNVPRITYTSEDKLLEQSVHLFYSTAIHDMALKDLGVCPDLYAGLSIGEWYAARAGGLINSESIDKMYAVMQENAQNAQTADGEKEDRDHSSIIIFVNYDVIENFCNTNPGIHHSIDYSPNCTLLAYRKECRDILLAYLHEHDIAYQELPFGMGFHTPLLSHKESYIRETMNMLEMSDSIQSEIPVWSATTQTTYPTDKQGFEDVIVDSIIKPVYFKQLIEKLYDEENVRVFVQVDSGIANYHVENTLKGRQYSIISSGSTLRDGIKQIHRVLALLFIEGKEVDLEMMGAKYQNIIAKKLVKLPSSSHITYDFDVLKEAVSKYVRGGRRHSSTIEEVSNPILKSLDNNLDRIVTIQDKMAKLVNSSDLFKEIAQTNVFAAQEALATQQALIKQEQTRKSTEIPQANKEVVATKRALKGTTFEDKLRITLDDHPYLRDHSIIRQPDGWPNNNDLNPIVPMTMILELAAEIALKQDPTRKVLKIGPAMAMKWMSVENPFEANVVGRWKTNDTVSIQIKGHAVIEVTLGDEYPEPPAEYLKPIDLGEEIREVMDASEMYNKYQFHGPAYQSTEEFITVRQKGIVSKTAKKEGKGSLVDSWGQTLGMYLHLTETEDTISFPVRLREITYYDDMFDQEGIFDQTVVIRDVSATNYTADVIAMRNGKMWAFCKSWVGQRFEFDERMWFILLKPQEFRLSLELDTNVYYYEKVYERFVTWIFLSRRYLHEEERLCFESFATEDEKMAYLIRRITVKDAVRCFNQEKGAYHYPIEVSIKHDEKGKPSVYGYEGLDEVEISVAHKGMECVSIVSDSPVGIDIEIIEKKDDGFYKASYTDAELELLKDKDLTEWAIRFWVAKEAYGKMLGVGLEGRPKQYEVEKIEGDILFIKGVKIKTIIHKENYIVGWTTD